MSRMDMKCTLFGPDGRLVPIVVGVGASDANKGQTYLNPWNEILLATCKITPLRVDVHLDTICLRPGDNLEGVLQTHPDMTYNQYQEWRYSNAPIEEMVAKLVARTARALQELVAPDVSLPDYWPNAVTTVLVSHKYLGMGTMDKMLREYPGFRPFPSATWFTDSAENRIPRRIWPTLPKCKERGCNREMEWIGGVTYACRACDRTREGLLPPGVTPPPCKKCTGPMRWSHQYEHYTCTECHESYGYGS